MFTQEIKDKWIPTMQDHQDADRWVQGAWLADHGAVDEDGLLRGCFFGCSMQTEDQALEKATQAMQLPFWLISLAERIFENLPVADALIFPVQLLKAIPVETDLEPVYRSADVAVAAAADAAKEASDAAARIAARIAAWRQERDLILKALTELGGK